LVRLIVVLLDRDVLLTQVVAPLAAKYFGDTDDVVTIASGGRAPTVLYSSAGSQYRASTPAEVAVPVFTLRADAAHQTPAADAAPGGRGHLSITIVRRADGAEGSRV